MKVGSTHLAENKQGQQGLPVLRGSHRTACVCCCIIAVLHTACRSSSGVEADSMAPRAGMFGLDISAQVALRRTTGTSDSAIVASVTLTNTSDSRIYLLVADAFPVMFRLFASNDTTEVAAFNSVDGKGGNRALRNITIDPSGSAQLTAAVSSEELRVANLGLGPYRGIVTLRAVTPHSFDAGQIQFSPLR